MYKVKVLYVAVAVLVIASLYLGVENSKLKATIWANSPVVVGDSMVEVQNVCFDSKSYVAVKNNNGTITL